MKTISGTLTPIRDHVIVSDMYFGEQKTKSGLILGDDNGTTRGIYARWGRVYKKGPQNNEEYQPGDWVLVEHGRWTRAINMDDGENELELRMVEVDSIIGWSHEKPEGVQFGQEFSNGDSTTFDPASFVNV
jgi:co-chaperonin GroES (HSP10)